MDFEVSYSTKSSFHRAGERLAIGCVSHLFAFDTIFLSGECKGDVRCREQVAKSSRDDIEMVHGTDFKFDISKAEGMFGITCSISVFSWA